MVVDVLFKFAKVYDITKLDVVKGESFSLIANLDPTMHWFSDNDPVLEITSNTDIVAREVGHSTLLILNETFNVVKQIDVTVVDGVDQAKSLNVKTDSKPQPKTK